MRLVFHSRVAADVARIMGYYEELAGAQLAEEFYSELQSFFRMAASRLSFIRFALAICAASTFNGSRITFFFELPAIKCAFSWLATTSAIPPKVYGDVSGDPGRADEQHIVH